MEVASAVYREREQQFDSADLRGNRYWREEVAYAESAQARGSRIVRRQNLAVEGRSKSERLTTGVANLVLAVDKRRPVARATRFAGQDEDQLFKLLSVYLR